MHQHRRRKKQSSFGVSMVKISRGKNGFGFTISGQAPCILSCIITGSPADLAGLKPGDFLITVNGQNVSKFPHDDVVRLIANSNCGLKLEVAENYFSDSSDEEFASTPKLRPKYANKSHGKHHANRVTRAERVVEDLHTGALFVDHVHGSGEATLKQRESIVCDQKMITPRSAECSRILLDLLLKQKLEYDDGRYSFQNSVLKNSDCSVSSAKARQCCLQKAEKDFESHSQINEMNAPDSFSEIFHSLFTEQDLTNNVLNPNIYFPRDIKDLNCSNDKVILKAVVCYLGTIEMPKEPQLPISRLQTIRNCIRRLRVEKKVHTLVLMSVFLDSIILINLQGVTLAKFSADTISFSGVYSDDKNLFGLVTNHGIISDKFRENCKGDLRFLSSSCHVFMVDPNLAPHHLHLNRAKAFCMTCTVDPITKKCKEFPESADMVLQAIVSLYRNKLILNSDVQGFDFHVNMSPYAENVSSNSSNSDSGIGFRDDCNSTDQIIVVDVGSYHHHSTNSLDRRTLSAQGVSYFDSPLRSFSFSKDKDILSSKDNYQFHLSDITRSRKSPSCLFNRLTVRVMPDPVGFENSYSSHSEHAEQSGAPICRNSLQNLMNFNVGSSYLDRNSVSIYNLVISSDKTLLDTKTIDSQVFSCFELHVEKLSHEEYGLNFPNKSVYGLGFLYPPINSVGWNLTYCSDTKLSPQLNSSLTRDTAKQKVGIQNVYQPAQEEDSLSDASEVCVSSDALLCILVYDK